jgi:CHAT domain-containing protein/tetratricopeptide (TPR) repeat protein
MPTATSFDRPPREVLWYDAWSSRSPEVPDANPLFEEAMKGPQALAVLSLALTGLAVTACDRPSGEGTRTISHRRRPVEPRVTSVAAYAPCRVAEDAADLVPDAVCGDPPLVAGKIPSPQPLGQEDENAVRGGEGAPQPAHREIGLEDLLVAGEPQDLNRAIRMLEERTVADPHDARAWSDLAAVHLVRAQRADDPRDLIRAYGFAVRAVREDGFLPEARFNQALALERLYLTTAAGEAWKEYLNLDNTSDWAAEAKARRLALGRREARAQWDEQKAALARAALAGDVGKVDAIVGRFRQAAREYVEQQLLGLWAEAAARGEAALAADRLRIARVVGDALVRIDGESLVHDAVATIDAAATTGDPGRWRTLVQGHRDFGDGYRLYVDRKSLPAAAKLESARKAFTRVGSPMAGRAAFFLACCDYLDHRYGDAMAKWQRLGREIEGRPYAGLRGHVFRMIAVSHLVDGRMGAAVENYGKALSEFRRLGEGENVTALESLLGENMTYLGRGQEAWRHNYQALRATPKLRDAAAASMVFMIAADTAMRDGADAAALAFQEEAVRRGEEASLLRQVETLIWLGNIQGHLGRYQQALSTLREARRRVEKLDNLTQRRRREADLARMEGAMLVEKDPSRAIGLLTSALDVYQPENNLIFSLRTLRARARAYRTAGDDVRAERDLEAGLAIYDQMGEQLRGEDLRLALVEETGAVFDEMIALQAERDPGLAFAYADRARTRVLPGSASKLWTGSPAETSRLLAAEPRPLPISEIRRRIPFGVTLVQFYVLEDRVLIWTLRRDGAGEGFFQKEIRREDLESLVAKLRAFDGQASKELFDLLLRPWLPETKGERLVFVPDKALHLVPFAALQGRTGDFLIETHAVAIAPSATLYVNALDRERDLKSAPRSRGLVVGEPAIDRGLFPGLSSLPGAKAEAVRLKDLTGAVPLMGKAADKPAFLAEAARADWIHFAGHALVDPRNTLLSKLLLAPGNGGGSGELTAREIYTLDLRGTRLVALAACDTGSEYVPGSEGVTSLARAFLAAGVPTVVASLWNVDDRSTSRLFDAFHRNLLAGEDPVDALRNAQLGLLGSHEEKDSSPRGWGAFQVIGASAN